MKTAKKLNWIYKNTKDNSARFVLGEVDLCASKDICPLICFGINSSTAKPGNLDRTVNRVCNTAHLENFDGWIMLNLYPQRATDPANIHNNLDTALHQENLRQIKKIFKKYPKAKVWAAWGNLITHRPYLRKCCIDILAVTKPYSAKWLHKGELTNAGHPRHPLYLRQDTAFNKFHTNGYLA